MLTENDINSRLQKSRADCIIVNEQLAAKVEGIASKHENLKHKIFVPENFGAKSDGKLYEKGWVSLTDLVESVKDQDLQNCPVSRY